MEGGPILGTPGAPYTLVSSQGRRQHARPVMSTELEAMEATVKRRLPLHNPADARDACGVGFVASRDAARSHRMTELAVQCLHGLDHRGAKAADGTGDGAGVMTRLPFKLLHRELAARGISAPPEGRLGVIMVFLPRDEPDHCRKAVQEAVAAEGIDFLTWRPVPVGPMVLSEAARASQPIIEQALVEAGPEIADSDGFERSLFLARREAAKAIADAEVDGFSVSSASCRTVVYKG